MADIRLKDVNKRFGNVQVINGVNLDVEEGEFCVFVGPSGLRQVHAAAHGGGAGGPIDRAIVDRRPGRHPPAARGARRRHGVSVLRALPRT